MEINPRELKDITKATLYVDEDVLKTAPDNKGKLKFFTVGRYITAQQLKDEYKFRDLAPANVFEVAEWWENNQNKYEYLATQWKDADGKWCYATFYRWRDERHVNVYRNEGGWGDNWWLAGVPVRKSAKNSGPKDLPSDTLTLE